MDTSIEKALDLVSQGKIDEAFKIIEGENEPGKKEYLTARLFFKAGNFEKGVENLSKAVEADSKFAVLWEKIGDDLVLLGKIDDARNAYERVYISLPQNSEILLKIGECHITQNEPEKAIGIFESFIRINGENEIALKRIEKAKDMLG